MIRHLQLFGLGLAALCFGIWCSNAPAQAYDAKAETPGFRQVCSIRGIVLNAEGGQPLPAASITLHNVDQHSEPPLNSRTIASGAFSFSRVPCGRYIFSIHKTGFLPIADGVPGETMLRVHA